MLISSEVILHFCNTLKSRLSEVSLILGRVKNGQSALGPSPHYSSYEKN